MDLRPDTGPRRVELDVGQLHARIPRRDRREISSIYCSRIIVERSGRTRTEVRPSPFTSQASPKRGEKLSQWMFLPICPEIRDRCRRRDRAGISEPFVLMPLSCIFVEVGRASIEIHLWEIGFPAKTGIEG